MFKLFLAMFAIATFHHVSALHCSECDYVVPSVNKWTVLDNTKDGFKFGAGDKICLSGQNEYKGAIVFSKFVGAKNNPIVITNCDGQAVIDPGTHCLFMSDESDYFHIDGSGSNDQYGIRLKDCSFGVRITSGSGRHYSEISRVYADGGDGTHASFRSSTDPEDPKYNADNFEMRNAYYHDNKCRNSGSECFYVGFSNGDDPRKPHKMYNVQIYNNIVESSRWDALQLGMCREDCAIYNNIVYDYGTTNSNSQNSGIFIQKTVRNLKCYNNIVMSKSGKGGNAMTFHGDGLALYNNVFQGNGGFAGHLSTPRENPGKIFDLKHNTVITPKSDTGIKLYIGLGADLDDAVVTISNNAIVKSTDCDEKETKNMCNKGSVPGSWKLEGSDKFYAIKDQSSTLVDAAGNEGISTDLRGVKRPEGGGYDFGAYEYTSGALPSSSTTTTTTTTPAPGGSSSSTTPTGNEEEESDSDHGSDDHDSESGDASSIMVSMSLLMFVFIIIFF